MIARSIVNNDAMNNEEDGVEGEEPGEEYNDDVVLEEIGYYSDEDETTDTAQQIEKMKMTVEVTMTAKTTTTVIMTTTAAQTTTTSTTTTRAVAALATMSINEGNNGDTAKKCANKWYSVYYEIW